MTSAACRDRSMAPSASRTACTAAVYVAGRSPPTAACTPSATDAPTTPTSPRHRHSSVANRRTPCSAADRAHAALGLLEERAVDEVARLLAPHGGVQQLRDLVVGLARTHRAAEVVLAVREQARADL